jgi:hypothetical protein
MLIQYIHSLAQSRALSNSVFPTRHRTVMVAYNPRSPRDESPKLSPEVAAQLRSALSARWTDRNSFDGPLTMALAAAAEDAHTRGLRPEELLMALKAIEQEVALSLEVDDTQDRDRFRIWLVGACMRAFFADEKKSEP